MIHKIFSIGNLNWVVSENFPDLYLYKNSKHYYIWDSKNNIMWEFPLHYSKLFDGKKIPITPLELERVY